jgi:hypothetical protein
LRWILDQLNLCREELVGIIELRELTRFLSEDSRGSVPIDVDLGRTLIHGANAERDDQGGNHASGDESEDSPFMPADNPQIVGRRNRAFLGLNIRV